MRRPTTLFGAIFLAAGLATAAVAETDMEKALANGAKRMTADQIIERLAGNTVTFERAATGDRALVYYDQANGTLIKRSGSEDVFAGFYAVSLADHVCLGAKGDEPIRLRCVNVVLIDNVMHKFELDGSLRGRVVEEAEGNLM